MTTSPYVNHGGVGFHHSRGIDAPDYDVSTHRDRDSTHRDSLPNTFIYFLLA